jgi:prevent-host-death family protein
MVIMTILVIMKVVTAAEAKAGLSDLLRRAEAGEEIVVTRSGVPVAKVVPIRPRTAGLLRGEVVINDEEWWKPDDSLADSFGI